LFGIDVINLMRKEHPEWFGKDFEDLLLSACQEAFETEKQVVDWILEAGELDFLPKAVILEFIKYRLNRSLTSIQLPKLFTVDEKTTGTN